MKSLQTVQKTFRVFQILTQIAMILCFVWAGLAALGMLCGAVWYHSGAVIGTSQELLYRLTETGGLAELTGVLLTETIFALTDGILLAFAYRYLKGEQADGTPFTMEGARQIKNLGIRTIVLPMVAVIVAAVVSAIFHLHQSAGGNCDINVAMGIGLILTSLVFRYGAEVEGTRALPAADAAGGMERM